ncbi:MAG TPA: hypothetical protein PKC76_05825 [Saprospiraceae bacterium]|nr:hypothetical protein [Saprospiraceae bacterium]HMP23629.1 hypothetical protein [Saprospiraceae bacterium]
MYYISINGVRYDRQLLEDARGLKSGQGDGRISVADMQAIVKLAKDGENITAIEMATLRYIRRTFNLTAAAARWFDEQYPPERTPTSYYQIIDGVRYDRQLLEDAMTFKSGQGDGRISEADIQEIVQLAMDGRGKTPVELATLYYIRKNYNLTDAAARWFDERFPPEPEPTSFYQVIDGVRYDRQLLQDALGFKSGTGDGRISEADMRAIVKLAEDGWGITPTEVATLHYIRQNYNLTKAAKRWFDEQFPSDESFDLKLMVEMVEGEFLLPGLAVDIDEDEARIQGALEGATVSLEQALQATLRSFLYEDMDGENPRELIVNVHDIRRENFDSEAAWNEALLDKLHHYLNNGGKLRLLPLEIPTNEDELDFSPPHDGESTRENWIFQLQLPKLSDHVFWAVTDRSGAKATYHYGFN